MKGILIFIVFFFISAEIKAQVGVTSLKIIELPAQAKAKFTEKTPGKGKVVIINPNASQVREIESQPEVKEPASQKNNKESKIGTTTAVFSGSANTMQMTNLNQGTKNGTPLIVYQFNPR